MMHSNNNNDNNNNNKNCCSFPYIKRRLSGKQSRAAWILITLVILFSFQENLVDLKELLLLLDNLIYWMN